MNGSRERQAPIRGVSFDATGTLFHAPRLAAIYQGVLARHGLTRAVADVAQAIAATWQEFECRPALAAERFGDGIEGARSYWQGFLERLCEHLAADPPGPFAVAELFARFAEAGSWEVYPDVRPALGRLREAGLRLAVLSNWDVRLPVVLERLELEAFFDAVVFSQEVGVEKPHPEIFAAVVRALELEPASILHVGDRATEDVEGARAAGWQAVLLDREGEGEVRDLLQVAQRVVDAGDSRRG